MFFESIDDKFVIAQNSSCTVYNLSGKKIKHIQMPSKSGKYKWEFSFFMNSGYLTFLSKDWTINSFKIISTSKEKESPTFSYYQSKKLISGYKSYITNLDYKPEKRTFGAESFNALKSGNYGIKEIDISNIVNTVINSYYESKTTASMNRDTFELISVQYNLADMENILNLIPLLQSHYFQQKIAYLLSVEDDKTMILKLLKGNFRWSFLSTV